MNWDESSESFRFSQLSAIKFLLLVLAIVAWTYWAPLVIAILTGTLTEEQIKDRVRSLGESQLALLTEQSQAAARIKKLRNEIDAADNSQVEALLETYSKVTEYENAKPSQIRIAKYANSKARHYFFVSYLALCVLVMIHVANSRQSLFSKSHIVYSCWFASIFFLLFHWSNWWRNGPWGQSDRVLFSYAHFDISPVGFAMQEFQALGMLMICGYFAAIALESNGERPSSNEGPVAISSHAKREFELWQIRSLLLAVSFLPWTMFYWRIVTEIGESRYFPSAISIHFIWAFLWFLASIPALRALRSWQVFSVNSTTGRSLDEIKKIQMLEPISQSNFFASAFASLASFVFPLIKAFL